MTTWQVFVCDGQTLVFAHEAIFDLTHQKDPKEGKTFSNERLLLITVRCMVRWQRLVGLRMIAMGYNERAGWKVLDFLEADIMSIF